MLLITLVVFAIFALGWHSLLRKHYWVAVFCSGVSSGGAMSIIAASHTTDFDIFIFIAIGLVVAVMVGMLMRWGNSRGNSGADHE